MMPILILTFISYQSFMLIFSCNNSKDTFSDIENIWNSNVIADKKLIQNNGKKASCGYNISMIVLNF